MVVVESDGTVEVSIPDKTADDDVAVAVD